MTMNEEGDKIRERFDSVPTGLYEVYAWYYGTDRRYLLMSEHYEDEEDAKARLRQVETHRILDLGFCSTSQAEGTAWGEDRDITIGVRQVVANRRVG